MQSYQLPGVIGLMIALLIVQILLVWIWGVESRGRGLEAVANKTA
jgi:putative MFS transporter